MSQTQHQDLARGRWYGMTLAEQLGNVGSEYSRARQWKKKGSAELFEKAFGRFLELMDLTITDSRWRGLRRRELARVRDEACSEFTQNDLGGLNFTKYFDSMATIARGFIK